MCIVLKGQDGVVEQARRQLEDLVSGGFYSVQVLSPSYDPLFTSLCFLPISTPLTIQVPVWAVLDYTSTSIIERELLLAKVSILGPEFAQEQLSGGPTHSASFDTAVFDQNPHDGAHPFTSTEGDQTGAQASDKSGREQAMARSFEASGTDGPEDKSGINSRSGGGGLYPSRNAAGMTASEALIAKNLHLAGIKTLADQFGGRVVDVAENSCIVELTAKSSRVEAFLSLMRPFGVLEAARSGEFGWWGGGL